MFTRQLFQDFWGKYEPANGSVYKEKTAYKAQEELDSYYKNKTIERKYKERLANLEELAKEVQEYSKEYTENITTKIAQNPKDQIGRKKDAISLVPPEGIRQISKAMKYGAYDAKRQDGTTGYGPYNWRSIQISYTVYLDAILRHTLALVEGNDLDKDSNLNHLAHIGANVCLLLDAQKHNCLIDDRPISE